MELGKKIRQARLEAGLSQRQLCGEEITRNMLSLIETGSAKPSMKTLQYLSSRLGKSVSYFLDDAAVLSPNQSLMDSARRLFEEKDYPAAALVLTGYRGPDATFDRERELLWVLTHLNLAHTAIEEKRFPYALELLEKADISTAYCHDALSRQRLLLLGRIPGQQVSRDLPSLDEELFLRASEALSSGDSRRASHLLEAMESHTVPRWYLLRGQCYLEEQDFQNAAHCFHAAESTFPKETASCLEQCYRELQDYKRAYEYACKQK